MFVRGGGGRKKKGKVHLLNNRYNRRVVVRIINEQKDEFVS